MGLRRLWLPSIPPSLRPLGYTFTQAGILESLHDDDKETEGGDPSLVYKRDLPWNQLVQRCSSLKIAVPGQASSRLPV